MEKPIEALAMRVGQLSMDLLDALEAELDPREAQLVEDALSQAQDDFAEALR